MFVWGYFVHIQYIYTVKGRFMQYVISSSEFNFISVPVMLLINRDVAKINPALNYTYEIKMLR